MDTENYWSRSRTGAVVIGAVQAFLCASALTLLLCIFVLIASGSLDVSNYDPRGIRNDPVLVYIGLALLMLTCKYGVVSGILLSLWVKKGDARIQKFWFKIHPIFLCYITFAFAVSLGIGVYILIALGVIVFVIKFFYVTICIMDQNTLMGSCDTTRLQVRCGKQPKEPLLLDTDDETVSSTDL